MRRVMAMTAVAALVLAGCRAGEIDQPQQDEEVVTQADPSPAESSGAENDDTGAVELTGNQVVAADFVEERFGESDYYGTLIDLFEALGSPDVEGVQTLGYRRDDNTVRLALRSGVSDPSDLQDVGWIITSLWANHISDLTFWNDLAADFELQINGTSWRCTAEDLDGINDRSIVQRHWNALCSPADE